VDPFSDYYLCTKNGETELVEVFWSDGDAPVGYDSVQELAFWQALQLVLALEELLRSPAQGFDLFPLAAFLEASEEVIDDFFRDEPSIGS
jgi:hypothetical protein